MTAPTDTAAAATIVFLFSDIEGSTRLWEQQPVAMRDALQRHDQIAREAVARCGGHLVKSTGDGIHAAFADAGQALAAMLQLQQALADAAAAGGLALAVRCGLHAGRSQARDSDYFGPEVNRAARIMAAAHGGQMLMSQAVADQLAPQLPAGVSLRDLGAVRLKDLPRPERLWQVVAPPLRSEFPALRSLQATPNNLSAPLNRFIGREAVQAELAALLEQHRLVTLFGTGGIGKSRLSVQLGATLLDRFADGVWLVELAPVADPERVPQAVAAALGLREQPGQALDQALRAFVADRQLLLILDNCEHVLAAAAALAKALLQAGPQLRLLATSREVLRVAGELAFPVPALTLPALPRERRSAPAPDELLQHEAVRMFADRAASALPGFCIDADNAAALVEICHRLDGIPLALELAAARVRALPLPAIAERLRSSFQLLSTRDATVAPRQRTLQVLIDWSHDLLGPDERRLFRRLAVFAGGWTLDAAEAVCADGDALPADAVLDGLSQLVEKSLVITVPGAGAGGHRYRLLETVRLYAAARLQAAPDAGAEGEAAVRDRHLAFYGALAEAARTHLGGPDQAQWLARLDAERDNLLAAQAHAAQAPDGAAPGLRLAGALRAYWTNRGLLTLGLAGQRAALAHPQAQAGDLPRARGLFHAGHLCICLGRHAEARAHLEACVAIVRALGEAAPMAAALQPLGTVYAALGDAARARDCFEEAVAAERRLGRPHQLAAALVALALWHAQQQQADAAEPLYLEALAIAREQGDDDAVATTLLNLAMLAMARHQLQAAVPGLLEALALTQRAGSWPLMLSVFDLACSVAVACQDWPHAWLWRQAAEAVGQRTGLHREAADAAFLAPWLALLHAAPPAPQAADDAPDPQALLPRLHQWLGAFQAQAPALTRTR